MDYSSSMGDEKDTDDAHSGAEVASAVLDAGATLAPLVVPALAAAGPVVVFALPVAKAVAEVATQPPPADRAFARADLELGAERGHRVPALEQRLDAIEARVVGVIATMTAEKKVEPLVHEVARLVALGNIDERAVSESPELAHVLFRSYRDMHEALEPRVGPALARLVEAYQSSPLTRIGRAIGEFLRQIEPSEWEASRVLAANIEVACRDADFAGVVRISRRRHAGNEVRHYVEVIDTQGWSIPEAGGRLMELGARVGVFTSDHCGAVAAKVWMREEVARFFVYILLGGARPPLPGPDADYRGLLYFKDGPLP